MRTSEILDLAADQIEKRGWTQGWDGWSGANGSRLCIEGGIIAAIEMGTQSGLPLPGLRTCPAYKAVASYLNREILWIWNDSSYRDQQEVIEVLRACAAVERAREESLEGSEVLA